MKTKRCFTLYFCLLFTINAFAQLNFTKEDNADIQVRKTFAELLGPAAEPVVEPDKSLIYIGITSGKDLWAVTNFRADKSDKIVRVRPLGGLVDVNELKPLFDGASGSVKIEDIPLVIDNEVFDVYMDFSALSRFRQVETVSKKGIRYPVRNGMVVFRDGFLCQPNIKLHLLEPFLFDRPYAPDDVDVISLLNNEAVNKVYAAVFPHFQALRTIDQLNRAINKSKEKVVFIIGQQQQGRLVRYRYEGGFSYALPLTQFKEMGEELTKEIIVIGCNFGDNPELKRPQGPLEESVELSRLSESLNQHDFGPMLQAFARTGKDSLVFAKYPGYRMASLFRQENGAMAPAYDVVFFDTRSRPPSLFERMQYIFDHAGKLFLLVALFQVMCFVLLQQYRWVRIAKWINWFLLLFLALCYFMAPLLA